jgi:hypothetical protein
MLNTSNAVVDDGHMPDAHDRNQDENQSPEAEVSVPNDRQ